MSAKGEKQLETLTTLAEVSRLNFLDVKKLRFFTHGITLRLTVEGDCSYLKVSILRAFPLTETNRFLSVRDIANEEVGLILNIADMGLENRKLVEEHLERRYLMPTVTGIIAAKERFGIVDWTMETDRGVCQFMTRNLHENVSLPTPSRIILNDVDGGRYDIRNIDELSLKSRELLFRYL